MYRNLKEEHINWMEETKKAFQKELDALGSQWAPWKGLHAFHYALP